MYMNTWQPFQNFWYNYAQTDTIGPQMFSSYKDGIANGIFYENKHPLKWTARIAAQWKYQIQS